MKVDGVPDQGNYQDISSGQEFYDVIIFFIKLFISLSSSTLEFD